MAILVQQSADVRFREIDLSQTLLQESAANAGIAFVSNQGREGLFHVFDAQQFKDEYGIPNASVSFGHYCALDYFREGNSLWALRVLGTGALYSAALLTENAGVMTLAGVAGQATPKAPNWAGFGAGNHLVLFYPKRGPGSYGNNVAVRIKSDNLGTPAAPTGTIQATGGTLPAGTYNYKVTVIGPGGESAASTASANIVIGSGTTNQITVTWTAVNGARGYKLYGRTGSNFHFITNIGATTTSFIDTGSITPDSTKTAPASYTAVPTFTVEVFRTDENPTTPKESFVCTLSDVTSADGVQQEITQRINPFSDLVNVTSNVPALGSVPTLTGWTSIVNLTNGTSGTAPTNSNIQTALDAFADRENVDVDLLINAGYTNTGIQQRMEEIARTRGTTVALLDVPTLDQGTPQTMIDWRNLTLNMNSSYAAAFGPDVLEQDADNGKTLFVPFSGWAAALCARTDRVAAPWYAIAGLNRGIINVLGTRKKTNGQLYSEGERTALFSAQINYTRNFTGQGIALWEQMTLQAKASALSWLSVRRMVNVIKKSTYNFLLYSVHEPNDEFTRQTIVGSISEYLEVIKNARGVSAYQVISNASNNPTALTNAGILKVTVFITPIIPVHEIQVDMVITKEGVTFSEINIANLG